MLPPFLARYSETKTLMSGPNFSAAACTETNVFELTQPGTFSDPLTEVLRNGARTLLGQAVEAEVAAWLSTHTDKLTDDGRRRLVRHGHLLEREIVTGIGAVAVRCPRVRDRVGEDGEHIRFSSTILPPYARRSKSLEVLIPILYLKGISTGDFEEGRGGGHGARRLLVHATGTALISSHTISPSTDRCSSNPDLR